EAWRYPRSRSFPGAASSSSATPTATAGRSSSRSGRAEATPKSGFSTIRGARVVVSPVSRIRRRGEMEIDVGTRVNVEAESTERPARTGVVEEVVGEDPAPRYRIRWDDGHESIYAPAAGAMIRAAPRKSD